MTGSRGRSWSWSWSRTALCGAGLAALAFGTQQLLTGGRATALGSSIPWLVGVLVVHDAVLAPAAVAVGWVVRRGRPGAGPGRSRAVPVVAVGLAVAAVLTLVAAAALAAPGVPGNPTALPRDYARGLAVLLGVDAAVTAAVVVIMQFVPRPGRTHRATSG